MCKVEMLVRKMGEKDSKTPRALGPLRCVFVLLEGKTTAIK